MSKKMSEKWYPAGMSAHARLAIEGLAQEHGIEIRLHPAPAPGFVDPCAPWAHPMTGVRVECGGIFAAIRVGGSEKLAEIERRVLEIVGGAV